MIDPLLAKARQAVDHPAPTRTTPAKRAKRTKPAQTSKIITAGASATALFGMVAAMGWQAGTGAATSSPPVTAQSVPAGPAVVDIPVVAVTVPTIAVPTTVVPATPVVTLPAATVPVATPAPVVVPVVVPVAKPVVKQVSNKRASNTVTKSSS